MRQLFSAAASLLQGALCRAVVGALAVGLTPVLAAHIIIRAAAARADTSETPPPSSSQPTTTPPPPPKTPPPPPPSPFSPHTESAEQPEEALVSDFYLACRATGRGVVAPKTKKEIAATFVFPYFSELHLWGFASVGVGKAVGVIQSTTNQSMSARSWLLQSEVHHVVDPTLKAAYERKKKQLAARLGAANVNEQFLFHGTSFENSEGIIDKNFCLTKNPGLSRWESLRSGDKGFYGSGFYFTKCPRYAIGHCRSSKRVLLLCKVLLGKSHDMKGNVTLYGCPRNPGFDSHVSTTAVLEVPQEVVVFEPEQVLPMYRIMIKDYHIIV